MLILLEVSIFFSSLYGLLTGVNPADGISDFTEYLYQALNDQEHALSIFLNCGRRLTLLILEFD